ncbi:MAG: helix-hairpin-helix domain-containing protein [Pseudomonadota bacterium]
MTRGAQGPALALATTLALAWVPVAPSFLSSGPQRPSCPQPVQVGSVVDLPPANLRQPWTARCDGVGLEPRGARAVLLGQALRVNSASARELQALAGLSRNLARAVVDERERGGAFSGPEDLQRVPGIGPRRALLLAPHLRFDDAVP